MFALLLFAGGAFLFPTLLRAQQYFYNVPPENYGAFDPVGGYGTVAPVPTSIYPDKAAWEAQKAAREADRERRSMQRNLERRANEEASEERRRNGYRPPPPERQEITLFGYQPESPQEIVEREIAANQAAARAQSTSVKAPKVIPGMMMVGVGDDVFYYKNGEFYALNEKEEPAPVPAPDGAVVFDVPKDSKTFTVQGTTYYRYKDNVFTRALLMGQVVFKVVAQRT